jgi:hypothetical protein
VRCAHALSRAACSEATAALDVGPSATWSFLVSASERVVSMTVPPYFLSSAIVLSGSARSITKNSAEVLGVRWSRTSCWKSSPMPFSLR